MPNKPKTNRQATIDQPATFDECQTPEYGVEPLIQYLQPGMRIWEPACGDGQISQYLRSLGFTVYASDILRSPWYDYLAGYDPALDPDVLFEWDIAISNPPYSKKYPWLAEAYRRGKPFAWLVPVDTNGSSKAQDLFKQYGAQELRLSPRINFKMPKLGYAGNGAQFNTFWLCWKLLPQDIMYAKLNVPEWVKKKTKVNSVDKLKRTIVKQLAAKYIDRVTPKVQFLIDEGYDESEIIQQLLGKG